MDTKDVAELFFFSIERIEFYWNFYVVSLLVLVGWLVSTSRTFSNQFKAFITLGYLAFAAMNLRGLWGSYLAAEALRLDLLAIAAEEGVRLTHTMRIVSCNSYENRLAIASLIHTALAVLFIWAIWKKEKS